MSSGCHLLQQCSTPGSTSSRLVFPSKVCMIRRLSVCLAYMQSHQNLKAGMLPHLLNRAGFEPHHPHPAPWRRAFRICPPAAALWHFGTTAAIQPRTLKTSRQACLPTESKPPAIQMLLLYQCMQGYGRARDEPECRSPSDPTDVSVSIQAGLQTGDG